MLDTPNRAAQLFSATRQNLLLSQPFFGVLALKLKPVQDAALKCLSFTDGTILAYNTKKFEKLIADERKTVIGHQVLKCGLRHPFRMAGRNTELANMASFIVVNNLLHEAGFFMFDKFQPSPQYAGMTFEQVYAILEDMPPGEGGCGQKPGEGEDGGLPTEVGPGDGSQNKEKSDDPNSPINPKPQGDPPGQPGGDDGGGGNGKDEQDQNGGGNGGGGEDDDEQAKNQERGNGKGDRQLTEEDWEVSTEQAMIACCKAGNIPRHLKTLLKAEKDSQIDWRGALHKFVQQLVPIDYSWLHPNKRYIAGTQESGYTDGIYLPSVVKENLPEIIVAVDTSGSISDKLLKLAGSELDAILHDTRPLKMTVLYCDTRVTHQQEFSPDDAELILEAKGRGGTKFQPVFDYVEQMVRDGAEPPTCLIYVSADLGSCDTPREPDYPVLWVASESTQAVGVFGETIKISSWR